MQIVVLANTEQKKQLLLKGKNENIAIEYINEGREIANFREADAFFILQEEVSVQHFSFIKQPLFIHSVVATLTHLHLPPNVSRINAWPTFLQRNLWEIATKDEAAVKDVFDQLGWKYIVVPDEPGFIAARIIAMIINEAYFAYGENISSKADIDVAMRLGTNHPFGPFEWAQKIGLQNIYYLLKQLYKNSRRYEVSPALKSELTFH